MRQSSSPCTDVRAPDAEREFVRRNMVLELTADDFVDTDVSSGLWEEIDKQNPSQKTYAPEPEVDGFGPRWR